MASKILNIIKLKDFAKELQVPESTVRTWRLRGDIPTECFVVIGSTVFVNVDQFNVSFGLMA